MIKAELWIGDILWFVKAIETDILSGHYPEEITISWSAPPKLSRVREYLAEVEMEHTMTCHMMVFAFDHKVTPDVRKYILIQFGSCK